LPGAGAGWGWLQRLVAWGRYLLVLLVPLLLLLLPRPPTPIPTPTPFHLRPAPAQVDAVLGDRKPSVEDMRALRFTTRVINESMRLYPQPPVLIRRALEEDSFDGYTVAKGSDLFISVWNLHRAPELWPDSDK
jgi:cytochrome P450